MRRSSRDVTGLLRETVRRSLAMHVPEGSPLALGLSGGRDSVVLLDVLVLLAPSRGHTITAIHVNHGLSPNADAWAQFCAGHCAALGIDLVTRKVSVDRAPRTSLESQARDARYGALADVAQVLSASVVALAHHRDDQAETLLLQLLRGAGPQGLAAMPTLREDVAGIAWWRPLLELSRADIDAYARDRALAWIDDESNADRRHARNAVRHDVLPALRKVAPQADGIIARAAAHQADAAELLDELAAQDAQGAFDGATLRRDILAGLSPQRARNLLRWFLRGQGLPAPSTARLEAMFDQLRGARVDSVIRLAHAGTEIGVHQGRIALHPARTAPFDLTWGGEPLLTLPHGTLVFAEAKGTGIDATRLASAAVRVRSRTGGERFQVAADRPRRALKSILRDSGIPAWERFGLPLVFCGDALAAVAGVGIDAGFQTAPTQPGMTISWHPKPR
ncbi:MAG: tRNA lysidine(34) synthetase TilS [Betaproteobacteria bacterium]